MVGGFFNGGNLSKSKKREPDQRDWPLLIDAHCHLDDEAYAEDRAAIIDALPRHGVLAVVNPGSDRSSSEAAVALAHQSPRIFACIGTHPHEAVDYTDALESMYREMAQDPAVVAIGEIGLDYHYDFSPREVQRMVFVRQLQLAESLGLPVVIHSREAAEDTRKELHDSGFAGKVLLHSYSETVEEWERIATPETYISLGGMVTFKNAENPKHLAAHVPLDRILIETDGPYLSPVPYRGETNLPWLARYSLETIAEIRGMVVDRLAEQVLENTIRFYGLEGRVPEGMGN